MTPERWRQVREVLAEALELKAEDRPAYLDRACSSNHSLRQEVEALLSSSKEARSTFLQSSTFRLSLTPGTKLGDYEVRGFLGSGGMGEVYRAIDNRLGREVAIKILPGFLSHDSDRLRRFEQEARAAAALNHPNILAVHQMGTYEGAPYLVSELLEGSTLRDLLARGPLPIRKAIDFGVQIVRGLAAAYEKGIVHRDLKPENLFVTKNGQVKILDFGLAKLTQQHPISDQSTYTLREGTEPGVVMGTVGYMSPEQVRGDTADHRADIFAFGAILYEMLTGKRAFQKPTSAETMSAILNEDPPVIPPTLPGITPGLQRLVHRCLEKRPEQRFQSASDLAFALEALSDSGTSSGNEIAYIPSHGAYRWAAAALILAVAIVTAIVTLTRSRQVVTVPTLTRITWDSGLTTDPALSPDSKLLAYASDRNNEGQLDIYVQQVGGGEPLRLTQGPGDKREPAFSPDGTTIAFHSEQDGGLYVVSTLGGVGRKIAPDGRQPRFSPDGKWVAYWVGSLEGSNLSVPNLCRMYVVSSSGGTPKRLRPDFTAAVDPIWSQDGLYLLFLGNRDEKLSPEESLDWWVTPLDSGPPIKTGALETTRRAKLEGQLPFYPWALVAPAWEPDGKGLVFSARLGDSTNLWRIGISPKTFKVAGFPQRLTSGPTREESPSLASPSGGTIRAAFTSLVDDLSIWKLPIERNKAKVLGQPHEVTRGSGGAFHPAISHDGKMAVFVSLRPGNQEIWRKDLPTGQESVVTASRMSKWAPRFSPDASTVSFSEAPLWNVYIVPSSGGAPEMVCQGCGEATDWSSDGKRMIGDTADGKAWLLDLASHGRADLLATRHWISVDTFSPDNRWVSFLDATAHRGYIAPMRERPVAESEWVDIIDGEPWAWSPDGNLIYATSSRDGHECIWARRLNPVTKHPVGAPVALFHSHNARLSIANQASFALDVAGDTLLFGMGDRSGNIWLAEWKEQ